MTNPNHPFHGRTYSSITDDELQFITEKEYQEYVEWGVTNALNYMMAEGFVESFKCPKSGEIRYRLASESSLV